MIYKYLKEIDVQIKQILSDNPSELSKKASIVCKEYKNKFEAGGFKVDYLEIINARNLKKIKNGETQLVVAVATHYKGVRLIDNIECDLSFP